MTFCSHCGAKLEGDERFCVACGTPVVANGAAAGGVPVVAAVAAPAPVPVASVQAAAVPTAYAGVPVGYVASPVPAATGMPEAPANRGGKMWVAIVLVAILAGSYYYSKVKPASGPAPAAPTGTPAQPAGQGQPVDNATLVQQQSFSGHWRAIYGYVGVTNAAWTNRSAVAIQSATLECDQYSANGTQLSQMRTTLNGPVQPGSTATFNPFQMGSVSTYMSRVNCGIVAVTPAS